DWSSDVCSSDLRRERGGLQREGGLLGVPDVDLEPVLLAELDDGVGRVGDVGVAEAEGLPDDQDVVVVGLVRRCRGSEHARSQGDGSGQDRCPYSCDLLHRRPSMTEGMPWHEAHHDVSRYDILRLSRY